MLWQTALLDLKLKTALDVMSMENLMSLMAVRLTEILVVKLLDREVFM